MVIKFTSSTEMFTNFKSTSISITADFTIIFTTSDKFEKWLKKDVLSHSKWVFKRRYSATSNHQFIRQPIIEALPGHTAFYLCDHADTDKKAKNNTGIIDTTNVLSSVDNDQNSSSNQLEVMHPKKARITMKSSIKIGYIAKISKRVMADGALHVEYHREHPDHCRWDIKKITNSHLPLRSNNG
ncbi:uncharacterized protein RHIMIDRAFT_316643 [Rhizopus microsporus ATCC 52813]|uniref:Uncharacterized protein n=1 Tax=Rhizopus microsporus ATCC 52813 TaxID=1340429 RepID=A0A2G4SFV3_RHIZD|nr:uncharacterized protein RHIMIDRAFT_316643 [Rhizopus microsporus ATCC 52813]PHZ07651.1 hypothetical protein RHIMIDRAFT_316643 [Rhizopus microsporus ATCC 52813]